MSLDRTGEGERVEVHRAGCRDICTRLGYADPVEYTDNSVSAYKRRGPDSQYAKLLADARAGRFAVLVVWDIDRLSRHPRELEDWIDITEQHGLRIVTADGEADTASENGRLYLRIRASVARHEVEHKARRQRDANAGRAAEGKPPSGRPPFGWGPGEGDAVRTAADLILHGGSLRSVCRDWNAAGFRTSFGGEWQNYAVRGVLLNPRIAGLRVYKGQTTKGTWEPLIEEETWRALVALLSSPARRTSDATARRWLLSGFARCGVEGCGATLMTGGRSHRGQPEWAQRRTYRCSAAHHMVRAAEPIEEYVTEHVLRRLARPDAARLLEDDARPDSAALRTEAQALRTHLDGLVELVADGTFTPSQARDAAARLRGQLREVEDRLANAGRARVLEPLIRAADLRATWAALDVDRQRTVAQALADVVVHPVGRGRRTFDPDTVTITWRGDAATMGED